MGKSKHAQGDDGFAAVPGCLSHRSADAVQPLLSYFAHFVRMQERLWSSDDPDGNLVLTVAENTLTTPLVKEKLEECMRAVLPMRAMQYDDMVGVLPLRQALASMLRHTFMQGVDVAPQHIVVSAGCGAIINTLYHCIADADDAVLIPSPYYPAFDSDLRVRCGCAPVPVALDLEGDIGAQLTVAADESRHKGHRVRSLLITNPNNPRGTIYSDDVLLQMLRWCTARQIHLVSDEIYGNSVFGDELSFTSMATLLQREASTLACDNVNDLVHVVFGLSKDFAASGLRVGCLYTRNMQLLTAYMSLGYFHGVSQPMQHALAALLSDTAFLNSFIAANKIALLKSYTLLTTALDAENIPYTHGGAAMFVWIDLRAVLPQPTWHAENALWLKLIDHGILLTPGKDCRAAEPGYFRICFSWMPAECMTVAAQRIAAACKAFRADSTAATN